jgi:hypothetical protein
LELGGGDCAAEPFQRQECEAALEVCHREAGIAGEHIVVGCERFSDASALSQCSAEVRAELMGKVVVVRVELECLPIVILRRKQELVIRESWRRKNVWYAQIGERTLCVAEVVLNTRGCEETVEMVLIGFEQCQSLLDRLFPSPFRTGVDQEAGNFCEQHDASWSLVVRFCAMRALKTLCASSKDS